MTAEHCAEKRLLNDKDIDVWLVFYGAFDDPALLSRMGELLSQEERAQQARFFFADDRKRYLATRAMVRWVLSRYADVEPADWAFSANAYGRPQLANGHPSAAGLSFNISHTGGLIALAVGRTRELGVDVENCVARAVAPGVADHFFSAAEAAELAGVAPARRQDRFFEYWTFKESYIKARGMGLSLPLDGFSFRFPSDDAVRLAIEAGLGDAASRWSFWQYRPSPDYLLALCAEKRDATQVSLFELVPTVGYRAFDTALLKTSEPGRR